MNDRCRECGEPLDAGADYIEQLCEECLFDHIDVCDVCEHADRYHDDDGFCDDCDADGPCSE